MTNQEYGIRKAKHSFPSIDLIIVPHKNETLVLAHPAFGPNFYSENRKEMQKTYTHSAEYPQITFRPATSSESISAVAYDIAGTKEKILDPRWLQLGYILRTQDGVFANLPLDENGNPIIDEKTLKSQLKKKNKVNGIYLSDNDFGFAPYETFKQGEQSSEEFAQGGLARLLEHTDENAINLARISSPKFYKKGVYVGGFKETKEPVLRVASSCSDWGADDDRLLVNGYLWGDGYAGGFAFGVVDSEAGDARKNK